MPESVSGIFCFSLYLLRNIMCHRNISHCPSSFDENDICGRFRNVVGMDRMAGIVGC